MDGPERTADAGTAGRIPRGEDCKLRGVPLRCIAGDLLASAWLRALPNEEALRSDESSVGGYRAYC